MPQAVKCELLLYADDTCLIFQHSGIGFQANKNVSLICDWFVDNKLSIHFGEIKLSKFFLAIKVTLKTSSFNIQHKGNQAKSYNTQK